MTRMRGTVTRVIPEYTSREGYRRGGYGVRFEATTDRDRFFHLNDVRALDFTEALEERVVDFIPLDNADRVCFSAGFRLAW